MLFLDDIIGTIAKKVKSECIGNSTQNY